MAAVGVGDADDCGFLDVGVFVDRVLDGAGIDVEAAADEHVLLAVDEDEAAVGLHAADVAGEEPAVDKGGAGLVGAIAVAAKDVGAADAEFAGLAGREAAGWVVEGDDVELDPGKGDADFAGGGDAAGEEVGAGGGGFGHAPAAAEAEAGEGVEALADLVREGGAAGAGDAEAGEVAAFDAGVGGEGDPHGGDAVEMGAAAVLDGVEDGVELEARVEDEFDAVGDGAEEDGGEGVDVEQGEDAEDAVGGAEGAAEAVVPGVVDGDGGGEVGVGEFGGAGLAGGAAGILEEGDVVGVERGPGDGGAVEGGEDWGALGDRKGGGVGAPFGVVGDDEARGGDGEGLGEDGGEVGGDEGLGAAIGELAGDGAGGVEGGEVDDAGAEAEGGEEGDRVGGGVGQQEGDGVAGAEAEGVETAGEAVGAGGEVGEGERRGAEGDGGAGGVGGGGAGEEAGEGFGGELDVPGDARGVARLPGEGAGHAACLVPSPAKPRPSAARRASRGAGWRVASPVVAANSDRRAAMRGRPMRSA